MGSDLNCPLEDYYVINMTTEEQKIKAWKEALTLWEKLANTPDKHVSSCLTDFKNTVLKQLGIGIRSDGCPFCEIYYKVEENCLSCPLNLNDERIMGCLETPYTEYAEMFIDSGSHRQELAKKFYEYLLEIYYVNKWRTCGKSKECKRIPKERYQHE